VGLGSTIPRGSISLSVTFGTPENYRTESVVFDVMKVNLPFNAIIGRSALYQFMVIAHYEDLVLKMPSPNGIIKIRGDRSIGVSTLTVVHEAAAGEGVPDQALSSLRQRISSSTTHCSPQMASMSP
jgi:hypothetical protein